MGRRRNRKRRRDYGLEELPTFRLSSQVKRGVLIVLFMILALLSFLSLFDAAGKLGEVLAKILKLLLGWGELLAPLIFLGIVIALFLARGSESNEERQDVPVSNLRVYLGAIFFTAALTGILHLLAMRGSPEIAFELVKTGSGGGYLGVLLAFPLFSLVDFWASILILAGVMLVGLIVLFNINLANLFRRREKPELPGKKISDLKDIKINQMEPSFSVSKVTSEGREIPEVARASDETITVSAKEEKLANYEELAAKYKKGNWQLPGIDMLEDSHTAVDSGDIEANVAIIQKTLADFGIEVEMGEVNVGPTVTQYTLRPSTGIKLSQIVALQNDLALALAAPSIRIEAPIPGRSLVGIEVPNKATAIVRLKDIIQTETFLHHKSALAFALGRDVSGQPIVADLARMPHLLIAGATGTGKSVAIHAMMLSFLYRNSPEELRMIIIDPKRVELNLYNGIPHLLTPVVTDHDKAVNALKWAVNEMDRRYNLLAASNRRNIAEYNQKADEKLAYIVIVVDELADLMAVAQADVEAAVVRLAQMARAVGVHLVVATQRPSVDIITGLIKANITARIAFAVASQVDSRTILDTAGADKLLGSGDMLYITSDLGRPKRIQGTYVSDKEVKNVVVFVQEQAGEPSYAEEILERQKVAYPAARFLEEGEDDELLPEAISVVRQAGKASASLLQRRLRLGYARAARLLDLMEEKGIIGPADGAKPRDVYHSDEET